MVRRPRIAYRNIENGLAEAVKFFNLNALSSSILVKTERQTGRLSAATDHPDSRARQARGDESVDAGNGE
jgi:hypothetical protein